MRRQIRAVLVVFAAEKRRLEQLIDAGGPPRRSFDDLRSRSLEILDALGAQLDGNAAWHPQLLRELAEARAQVTARD